MSKLDVLLKRIESMQSDLGVKGAEKTAPSKPKKRLNEFEKALLEARNKLKATEDKIEERAHAIGIYGDKSRARIDCDMQIRDLLMQSEEAVTGLEMSLTPMRKKFSSMTPEEQEEFKQKEKLVELIQDQLQANRSSFDNEEYVPRRRADPNGGLAVKKMELIGNRYDPQELTTVEAEALERYKERDKQIDDILVLIIQDIDLLKQKADNIDNAIERNRKNLKKVNKHADKTNKQLETMNKKLKDVINKYAQPSKMCLYVILLLLIVGLVMIIYKQIK
eukprot:TRINITY_DN12821_c0_g2_i8.p1 TRINITY_DN12821_c0_g2~~TRINITY_DN12821_c0_g2_i8.p1  ORF type:complete len:278 (-),score=114.89 TRINITY_DN12821_c0_g2_i8:126-959(-)